MSETLNKLAEKLGISSKRPKAEPEIDWFVNNSHKDEDGDYVVPDGGKWNPDGTPGKTKTVDPETYNRMIFKLNIKALEKKIEVYKSVKGRYEDEITRLENILKQGTGKAATDMHQRELYLSEIKWMWQSYNLRFRNRENSPIARAYRAKIVEMEKNIPAKTTLADHHNIKDRVINYDPKAMEAVASKRARNQVAPPIQPTQQPWQGDAEDLIVIYKGKIEQIEDVYIDPTNERLEANEEWLEKYEEKEDE